MFNANAARIAKRFLEPVPYDCEVPRPATAGLGTTALRPLQTPFQGKNTLRRFRLNG
jgi:hypothetical protein